MEKQTLVQWYLIKDTYHYKELEAIDTANCALMLHGNGREVIGYFRPSSNRSFIVVAGNTDGLQPATHHGYTHLTLIGIPTHVLEYANEQRGKGVRNE